MYDIIIIGAGPAGIFTALELIKLNSSKKVLIIEQGKKIEDRFCPIEKTGRCLKCKPCCNITSGFSGAGAFSDGKLLSYHLSLYNENENNFYLGGNDGAFIKKYLSSSEIKDLLKYTDDIYLEFGADKHLEGIENRDEILKLQTKAKKEDLNLIDIPLRHLGTEKAHLLYKKIQDFVSQKVDIMFNTSVRDIKIENNKVIGIIAEDLLNHEEKTILASKVIMAVGRKGASWLEKLCKEQLQDIFDFYEFCKMKNKKFIYVKTNENKTGVNVINHVKEMVNLYTNKDEFLKDAERIFNLVKDDEK